MFICLDCLSKFSSIRRLRSVQQVLDGGCWLVEYHRTALLQPTGKLSLNEALTTATPSRASEDIPLAFSGASICSTWWNRYHRAY